MANLSIKDIKEEIRAIQDEYCCELEDGMAHGDYLNAKEGFEELLTRLKKKVK